MSSIVTFYSFKGGVGRTMALANIAVLLARRGLKILAVDFDLEGPGLERYFRGLNVVDTAGSVGMVDLLIQAASTRRSSPSWKKFTATVKLSDAQFSLIKAGRSDVDYPSKVLRFNWNNFFQKKDGGAFIEKLREEWRQEYDITLIDSRTGITDSGGVCTIQLPDVLVPVFTCTSQSLEGVIDIIFRAQTARQRLAYDRSQMLIFPLPSRFDSRAQFEEAQQWLATFADRFTPCYHDWVPSSVEPLRVLERTKLPYVPYFSFGEKLPVLTHSTTDPESLGFAYSIAAELIAANFSNVGEIIRDGIDFKPNPVSTDFRRSPVSTDFKRSPVSTDFKRSPVSTDFKRSPVSTDFKRSTVIPRSTLFICSALQNHELAIAVAEVIRSLFISTIDIFVDPGPDSEAEISTAALENTEVFILLYNGVELSEWQSYEIGRFSSYRSRLGTEPRLVVLHDTPKLPELLTSFRPLRIMLPQDENVLGRLLSDIIQLDFYYKIRTEPDTDKIVRATKEITELFERYGSDWVEFENVFQRQLIVDCQRIHPERPEELLDSARVLADAETFSLLGIRPQQQSSWTDFQLPWRDFRRLLGRGVDQSWADELEMLIRDVVNGEKPFPGLIPLKTSNSEIYRLLLYKYQRYKNLRQQFHVALIDAPPRTLEGSERVVGALVLCLRIRSMFFEVTSEFSANNVRLRAPRDLKGIARKLLHELNMLESETMEAGLDELRVWRQFVSLDLIQESMYVYSSEISAIRHAAESVLVGTATHNGEAAEHLVRSLQTLEETFREINLKVLKTIVDTIKESIVNDAAGRE